MRCLILNIKTVFGLVIILLLIISCESQSDNKITNLKDTIVRESNNPTINYSYNPDFLVINSDEFPRLGERGTQKDTILQEQLLGLGYLKIDSSYEFILSQLSLNHIEYYSLSNAKTLEPLGINPRSEYSTEYPLIEGILIKELTIAGLNFFDLRLTFYQKKLQSIDFECSDKEENTSLIETIKSSYKDKFGYPLFVRERATPQEGLNSMEYEEELTLVWENIKHHIKLRIEESFKQRLVFGTIITDKVNRDQLAKSKYTFSFNIMNDPKDIDKYIREVYLKKYEEINLRKTQKKDSLRDEL